MEYVSLQQSVDKNSNHTKINSSGHINPAANGGSKPVTVVDGDNGDLEQLLLTINFQDDNLYKQITKLI